MLTSKRLLRRISGTIAALCFSLAVWAQQPVTGTLRTPEGDPLAGATITVKNSELSATTNEQGFFSIDVPAGAVLLITYIGYEPMELTVGNNRNLSLSMRYAAGQDLEQVVVVGYGTQRKKDLTGAVSVVDNKQLQRRQVTTVAEGLQGLATGINVRGGGRPGQEANIQIRGIKNLSGTNPLYVIDGMITTANRDFNPNDIESIQILKDASAAAIYGSRAANGVIIITTKRGKDGPMKVDVSAKNGFQFIPRYDLAETEEFARLNYMAYDNAGAARQNLQLENNTDWQDETYQQGLMQDLNIGFSGGSKNGNYAVSANYFKNKGTVISTDFERFSFRVNTSATKGIFSIGENLAISNAFTDEMSGNPIADVVRLLPTIPVYDESNPGGYGYGREGVARTFGTNPVAIADLEDRTNENLRIRGNLWSELQFIPSLKYRFNLGYETSADHYKYLRKVGSWTLNQPFDPAIADENRARSQSILVENTLTFDKTFGKHAVTVLAGQTYQKNDYSFMFGRKRNIPVTSAGTYIDVLDQGSEPVTGGYRNENILLSYLGRLEYSYDDKYLMNAVIRRDGSSRLSRQNQWQNYPSISGAWRVSQEPFFLVDWITDLKVRYSLGTLGSANIGNYDYIAAINTFGTIAMGRDQGIESSAAIVRLVNNNLRWEKLTQHNAGIDAGLFNNKIQLTAEYYIAETKDVLFGRNVLLSTGNDGGNPIVNIANLRNSGFELSLTYREDRRKFNYFVNANLTTINNKVLGFGFDRTEYFVGNTRSTVGGPIGSWFVLQTDGLFQSQEEVDNYKNKDGVTIQPNAKPGDIRFRDTDENGQINNNDKIVMGDPWADIELGLNMGASYQNFEFSMSWFGSFGATVFNGYRSLVDRFDDNSNYRAGIQPWTPDNTNTDVPRAFYGSTLNSRGDSDRWLESGDFMRLKLVSLGYSIPSGLLSKAGFTNAQISVQGQNLLTFTKYSGLDPEFVNGNLFERGFDNFAFPNLKTVSLGLQLGF